MRREDLPDLHVDEARMMQVFGNLLSNALRYTPPGERCCSRLSPAGRRQDMCVAGYRRGHLGRGPALHF